MSTHGRTGGVPSHPRLTPTPTPPTPQPQGIVPLGGSKVEKVERGPKGSKFGLKITHPDFMAGRALVLSADNAASQTAWLATLQEASRVTMANALLGDAMIEKLRAEGTSKESELTSVMEKLQAQGLALKTETEEKLRIAGQQEAVLKEAGAIEERARAKEGELNTAIAELEARRGLLQKETDTIQREVDARNTALATATAEYARIAAIMEAGASAGKGGVSEEQLAGYAMKARALEEEKMRLVSEKAALEKSVRDMQATSSSMADLTSDEARRLMSGKLGDLTSEESELGRERSMRIALERKLQVAEESLKRLNASLQKRGLLTGPLSDDVRSLIAFFEERIDETRRDAQRIDIIKSALAAKRRFLVSAVGGKAGAGGEEPTEGVADDSWGDEKPAAAGKREDAWDSDDGKGGSARSSGAASVSKEVGKTTSDAAGPLPPGWTLQKGAWWGWAGRGCWAAAVLVIHPPP